MDFAASLAQKARSLLRPRETEREKNSNFSGAASSPSAAQGYRSPSASSFVRRPITETTAVEIWDDGWDSVRPQVEKKEEKKVEDRERHDLVAEALKLKTEKTAPPELPSPRRNSASRFIEEPLTLGRRLAQQAAEREENEQRQSLTQKTRINESRMSVLLSECDGQACDYETARAATDTGAESASSLLSPKIPGYLGRYLGSSGGITPKNLPPLSSFPAGLYNDTSVAEHVGMTFRREASNTATENTETSDDDRPQTPDIIQVC